MENTITAFYQVTNVTAVKINEDGNKELVEKQLVGSHTVKEIKELLPENEVFFSKEQESKSLTFDLDTFMELRESDQI